MRVHRTSHSVRLATLLLAFAARASSAQQAPAAAELLRHAADNFTKTRALRFKLTSHQIPPGLHLSGVAEGDGSVVWPNQLVFSGSVQSSPALAMPFVMVTCGPDPYVEMGDGTFQKMEGAPNVGRLLFAPDTSFIANILAQLEQPSAPQTATLDQVANWHLTGIVPKKVVAKLPGSADSSAAPLRVELWIGQRDMRLHQMVMSGPMFSGDSAKTTRTLAFSHFDEKLSLTVPRGTSPCGGKQ